MAFGQEHEVKQCGQDEPFEIDTIAQDRVREHMSPAVQTVHESATLINAARVMCREHIHRLVIIDQDERPVGVVSSLDLVAAMIAAVEE
jgi:predicted transcriptional regulator